MNDPKHGAPSPLKIVEEWIRWHSICPDGRTLRPKSEAEPIQYLLNVIKEQQAEIEDLKIRMMTVENMSGM